MKISNLISLLIQCIANGVHGEIRYSIEVIKSADPNPLRIGEMVIKSGKSIIDGRDNSMEMHTTQSTQNPYDLNSNSISDQQEKIEQAGTIPFYRGKLILVTGRHNPLNWILPKGGIKKGETPEHAAIRETKEESGAKGQLSKGPGIISGNRVYFLMKVEMLDPEFQEKGIRTVHQVTLEEALSSEFVPKRLKKVLEDTKERLNKDTSLLSLIDH